MKFIGLSLGAMANLSLLCSLSPQLYASDYIWSPNSSLWLTDANWNSGEAWSDDNVAVFAGAVPADVEISGQVQAMDIKVGGSDYSFSGAGGIVMTNGFFDVADGFTATVDVPISQPNDNSAGAVNRFRKCGPGTLVIRSNAVFDRYLHMAGDTVIDGGTLTITGTTTGATANEQPFLLANGGKFVVAGGGKVTLSGGFSMNSGVEVVVTNGLFDFTSLKNHMLNSYRDRIPDNRFGEIAKGGPAVLTVQDKGIVSGGTFRVTQSAAPNTGSVNLNAGGVLALTRLRVENSSCNGSVNFNGGRFLRRTAGSGPLFSYSRNEDEWNGVSINVMKGGFHFVDGGNGTVLNRPLLNAAEGMDGGVHIEGIAGKNADVELSSENTYNGGTSIGNGVQLVISGDANLGAQPAVPSTNLLFKGTAGYLVSAADSGEVNLHANRIVAAADAADARFKASTNSSLVVAGRVLAPQGWIATVGNDTTLSGTVAFDPGSGNTNMALRLHSNNARTEVRSGVTRIANVAGGTGANSSVYVQGNAADWSSNNVLRVLSGGKLIVGGGYVSTDKYGEIEVAGGTMDASDCTELLNGHGSPGRISILDGGLIDVPKVRLSQYANAPSEIYLGTGGVLRTSSVAIDKSHGVYYKGTVCFDGGRLAAASTTGKLFGEDSEYYRDVDFCVKEGGAEVDTGEHVVRALKPLKGSENGCGGLRKLGSGYLILHQPCTYTGATEVAEGTLRLSGPSNILWEGSTLILGANAKCEAYTDHIGSVQISPNINCTQTVARVEGCGSVTHSSYVSVTNSLSPGLGEGGIGTLTFSRACNLSGVLEIDVGGDGADCLTVEDGRQTLERLSLRVVESKNLDPSKKHRYTIVSAPDGLDGKFSQVEFSSPRWRVKYTDKSVELSYVRGTCIIVR